MQKSFVHLRAFSSFRVKNFQVYLNFLLCVGNLSCSISLLKYVRSKRKAGCPTVQRLNLWVVRSYVRNILSQEGRKGGKRWRCKS